MKPGRWHRIFVASALGILFLILSWGFLRMPPAGASAHPAYNSVTLRYVGWSARDTNAPNVVNAIVTDYRAFDTLGEATVLFVGVTSVATVLVFSKGRKDNE